MAAQTVLMYANAPAVVALDEYGCNERQGMSIQGRMLQTKFYAYNTTPEEVLCNAWRGLSGVLRSHLLSHLSRNTWHRELLRAIVHACCATGSFAPPTAPPTSSSRRDDTAGTSTSTAAGVASERRRSSLGYASFPLEEQAFESVAASYLHFRTFPAAFGWDDAGAHADAVLLLDGLFTAVFDAVVPRNGQQHPEAALVGLLRECRAALCQFGVVVCSGDEGGEEQGEVCPLDEASNWVWVQLVDLLDWAVRAELPPARRMPKLAAAAVTYIKG